VFAIEIERCRRSGGKLEVIASIEDPALAELAHTAFVFPMPEQCPLWGAARAG
jgi:hypothetical protein